MNYFSNYYKSLFPQDDEIAFESTMRSLSLVMVGVGGVIGMLYRTVISSKAKEAQPDEPREEVSSVEKTFEKSPMTLRESLRYIASNSHLRNIATMVIAYGLTIEFTEIVWKAIVKDAFPVKSEYLNFFARYSTMIGIGSTVMVGY